MIRTRNPSIRVLCFSLWMLLLLFWTGATSANEVFLYQTSNGVSYTIAIAPKDLNLRIVRVPAQGVNQLLQSSHCSGYSITGGFTDKMEPSSLIEIAGEKLSNLERRPGNDGGILVIARDSLKLVRYRQRNTLSQHDGDKIQSYPVLIMNDTVDAPLKDRRLGNRVGFGLLEDGRLIFAIAHNQDRQGTTATTTKLFAKTILELIDPKIEWLLNFDGGASAFLTTPEQVIAPSNGFVSSFLCAE